jgi:hypothetical protein
MSSLSVLRTSSLSSLAAASQSVGNSDAVVSGDRPSASGGVGSASSGSGSGDSARIEQCRMHEFFLMVGEAD